MIGHRDDVVQSLITCVLLLCALTYSSALLHAREEQLRFDASASNSHIPYSTGDETHPGIIQESILAILEQAGLDAKPIALPPKRTLLALEQGILDFHVMSLDWFPNQDFDSERFVMSEPFITIDEYLIALANTPPLATDFSIEGLRIGTISGYFYHNQAHFERVDFPSEEALLKALLLKRVNYAIVGDLPGLYWARKLAIPITMLKRNSSGQLRLRLRKQKAHLLPQINQAIQTLNAQGKFGEIEEKYKNMFGFTRIEQNQSQ